MTEAAFDDPNDIEDPSKFDFGAFFGDLLKTGAELGKSYLNKPEPAPAPRPVLQQSPPWVMPALIGGGVLVLLLFAGMMFRK